ncbi:hypothetical protein EN829_005820 [Mesorhizobium sp. M00.F.Ca.ET.186.01.1.1]|nr:hypothetical protein EN848_02845 [bacterium M00.F.Ca.ET.205.01.1.1]TGU54779.1 hypothetical protein EN795_07260 [bacterium M00.F.Ca.ET.152.01.1.1]TGV38447.1 hypothetical protein EN829_005820 [Mesorhizobium sp. M00.F.Ca.ET.186.01.1.1]TGZ44351.1 hypothetical protein EN805_07265 [bacterium M00.F.Ca.ET.162.01.1.1]
MSFSLQVLSSGIVAAGLAVSSLQARADDVPSVQYVPVLDFYVDSLVTARSMAAVCEPANSPARDDKAWSEAGAILVASLWADGFPADFVKSVKARFDRPLAPAKIDCTSDSNIDEIAGSGKEGWVQLINEMLKGTGLRAIKVPVSDAQWKEIKAAIEGDLPAQTKLFDCVGAVGFGLLPTLIHDWNGMLIDVGQKLVAAGLPRDEVSEELNAADANHLWHKPDGAALASLRRSCKEDKSWYDRLATMSYAGISAEVDKRLPAPEAGDQ